MCCTYVEALNNVIKALNKVIINEGMSCVSYLDTSLSKYFFGRFTQEGLDNQSPTDSYRMLDSKSDPTFISIAV